MTEKEKQEKLIESLQKSLISSNTAIDAYTHGTLKELEDKSVDYLTKDKAEIWYPRAQKIAWRTKQLDEFLDLARRKNEFFESAFNSILDSLHQYRLELLNIDTRLNEEFSDDFDFISSFLYATGCNLQQKSKDYNPVIQQKHVPALLTMLQNEIKKTAYRMVQFCNIVSTVNFCGFETYEVLVAQSSQYIEPGGKLEIRAGIGAFSKLTEPIILINKRKIELGSEAFALYKMKAPNVPGRYSVPVNIQFVNPVTGKEQVQQINVQYSVTKPCTDQ